MSVSFFCNFYFGGSRNFSKEGDFSIDKNLWTFFFNSTKLIFRPFPNQSKDLIWIKFSFCLFCSQKIACGEESFVQIRSLDWFVRARKINLVELKKGPQNFKFLSLRKFLDPPCNDAYEIYDEVFSKAQRKKSIRFFIQKS